MDTKPTEAWKAVGNYKKTSFKTKNPLQTQFARGLV